LLDCDLELSLHLDQSCREDASVIVEEDVHEEDDQKDELSLAPIYLVFKLFIVSLFDDFQ